MFLPTDSLQDLHLKSRPNQSDSRVQTNEERVSKEVQNILTIRAKDSLRYYSELKWSEKFKDGESWALHIVKVLIDTLSFSGSEIGNFGTPEADIMRKLSSDIPKEKVWIKILGIKLRILENSLEESYMKESQKRRISDIIRKIEVLFSPISNSKISPITHH